MSDFARFVVGADGARDLLGPPPPPVCTRCGREQAKPYQQQQIRQRDGVCQRCAKAETAQRRREAGRRRQLKISAVLDYPGGSLTLPDGPFVLLYRCWGEEGRLLYVGITQAGMRRVRDHAVKGWFEREVIAMTFARVPARNAEDIETAVIRAERPAYNVRGRS